MKPMRGISRWLKEYMDVRGWRIADLAGVVEPQSDARVRHAYVRRVLLGTAAPPKARIVEWADRLGLDGGERRRFLLLAGAAHLPEWMDDLVVGDATQDISGQWRMRAEQAEAELTALRSRYDKQIARVEKLTAEAERMRKAVQRAIGADRQQRPG